jgi:hypothetical protein
MTPEEEFEEYRAAHRGLFQMLICVCTHKEHGHEDDIGKCSRCECLRFVERREP